MKNWAIIKIIKAETLKKALKNEAEAEIVKIGEVKKEINQLVDAVGFDFQGNPEDE